MSHVIRRETEITAKKFNGYGGEEKQPVNRGRRGASDKSSNDVR